ncbi:outer membrane protein assembly factor BamE [Usitatibacter palustris]|uniref:Uncharacterized protein n=1 Tax=Usitatibacter palustris TaxID=2732487 RepID=A0A6M4H8Y5_9PROT|nr:outer membrane protein assembly factor BamE [Usitatibacter palustris]QJR14477.1 hypothetical protein DSM104440_01275 [Usitatibacter palustris]
MKSLASVAFLALLGCASAGSLKPGVSTEADVRQTMGPPAEENTLRDGTRRLAYPQGPQGTQTYMVSMKDGRVTQVEQVLTDDQFQQIRAGTTAEEVRRMIGPPWRIVRFDNLKQDAWDYRFRDSWGYLADFSVMVDDRGIVASKVTVRQDGGRDRSK